MKIGLVSGDFRTHSVSRFLTGILPEIETRDFELFAYITFSKADDVTAQLRKNFSSWRNIEGESDEKAAHIIAGDEIDILIDLSGHSSHNRLAIFSRKPAPVQVTWLGYSGTTGVGEIDYILCDRWVIPAQENQFYVEKPWRLPDGYLCFSPPEDNVRISASPSLGNSDITFGSFNNLSKMSDQTVACWANIMNALPESRLLLKAKQLKDVAFNQSLWKQFSDHGISRERIILKAQTSAAADHLELYNQVDIALDPFPYCGTTTTAEALWMGVPVVTLRGPGFVSRVGESILQNIGRADWIADTPGDYVQKAVNLAANRAALSSLRRGLRDVILAAPLCDAPRFAKNFEAALRGMWKKWCNSPD